MTPYDNNTNDIVHYDTPHGRIPDRVVNLLGTSLSYQTGTYGVVWGQWVCLGWFRVEPWKSLEILLGCHVIWLVESSVPRFKDEVWGLIQSLFPRMERLVGLVWSTGMYQT